MAIAISESPYDNRVQSESDSDEEIPSNTIGNVPLRWYDGYEHVGYDLEAKKIIRPKRSRPSEIDGFLERMENPDYWRSVYDEMTGQQIILTNEDIALIKRMKTSKYANESYNEYEPWDDTFSAEVLSHPIVNSAPSKRSFLPSISDRKKVGRYLHAIRMGWLKDEEPQKKEREWTFYDLWEKCDFKTHPRSQYIPAPKVLCPSHSESYNPPPEYLPTDEEKKKLIEEDTFVPQRFTCLRHVPAYDKFINDRFDRCLDLYLCVRKISMKANFNPDDLLPDLPRPKDLRPFPTTEFYRFTSGDAAVLCLDFELQCGDHFVSGSENGELRIWKTNVERTLHSIRFDEPVTAVAWNPCLSLIAAAVGSRILILSAPADKTKSEFTEKFLEFQMGDSNSDWVFEDELSKLTFLYRMTISQHCQAVKQISWHSRGDYFACVNEKGDGDRCAVVIHQLSKRRSQVPFRRKQGSIAQVFFHPSRPFIFIAGQKTVRVYDLIKQELIRKLQIPSNIICSLAIHPGGDNLIAGCFDSRLHWFDLDLSSKPYKTMRFHKRTIRCTAFHRTLPLFASASDDGSVVISHGKVFDDLLKNALIVPVKVLRGHTVQSDGRGVLKCVFHPIQPWILTGGADGTIRLYTDGPKLRFG